MTAHQPEPKDLGIASRRPAEAGEKFMVSATSPTPLVRDFDVCLNALADPSVSLTKSLQTLDRATLHRIDGLMQTHRTDTHPRTDQMYYPMLNLLQRICAAERLFRQEIQKGKIRLVPTDRLDVFRKFNEAERWVALLEAFWVRCDWTEIIPRGYVQTFGPPGADMLMTTLTSLRTGKETGIGDGAGGTLRLRYADPGQHYLIFLFSLFGLIDCALAPPREICTGIDLKGDVVVRSFSITPLGARVLHILHKKRSRDLWNLPARMELGSPARFPGERMGRLGGLSSPDPFRNAFLPLFPAGAIEAGLPEFRPQRKTGTFLFKVNLGSGLWRTLALSDRHTLEDLHLAIQKAFGFDNDHLYSFHLDGRRHSRKRVYNDPRYDDYPPFANDVDLGGLDLDPSQGILYLFDFGAGWEFDVRLVEIAGETMRGRPRLVEGRGENPEQYPDEDGDYR